jgi:hypothetical protein
MCSSQVKNNIPRTSLSSKSDGVAEPTKIEIRNHPLFDRCVCFCDTQRWKNKQRLNQASVLLQEPF